ncbi:MAG: hypothetical protein GF353_17120 [Candidatus Lokiarchaeota archaeon]|nr:hypothetical protein [Candidatus Lokiarchaeota archaeon]
MEKNFRKVNLDGIPTKLTFKRIPIDKLILDESNPRIQFFRDNQIEQNLSQDKIYFALTNKKPDAFQRLFIAIEKNDGLLNPIWIQEIDNEKYLVLEGNTRTLIYKNLRTKYPNKKNWQEIDSYILPKNLSEEQKNFIKLEAHLGGTEDWDAYEKARELYRLNEEAGYAMDHLAEITRRPKSEIMKAIKAFKAMRDYYLPKYGDIPSEVLKYSYFEQYFNYSSVQKSMKKNDFSIKDFCDWVGTDKIDRAIDVRTLPTILDDPLAKEEFVKKGFERAIEILAVKKPDVKSKLWLKVKEVIEGMMKLSSHEINEIRDGHEEGKKNLLYDLYGITKEHIETIER